MAGAVLLAAAGGAWASGAPAAWRRTPARAATAAASALPAAAVTEAAPPPATTQPPSAEGQVSGDLAPHAASAVLMDAATGRILWEKNANQPRSAASITKLMTMAVVLDAIRAGRIGWNDEVSASEAAVATPGSQIWLELGENMTVRDLFIAVAVASANDAAYALAEHVGGTYDDFIRMMNEKAKALGMNNTVYMNPHGLEAAGQHTSAYDIALLSRYLVTRDPVALQYTKMWEYRLRDNKLWLVNRNKLLKQFAGTDGLKTGYTAEAGYGLAATAKRGDTRMIAVVLGEPSGALRFSEAAQMMQYGFAHFVTPALWTAGKKVAALPVELGAAPVVDVVPSQTSGVTVARGQEKSVKTQLELPATLKAPVAAGQRVGSIRLSVGGVPAGVVPLVAASAVARIGPLALFGRMFLRTWPW